MDCLYRIFVRSFAYIIIKSLCLFRLNQAETGYSAKTHVYSN